MAKDYYREVAKRFLAMHTSDGCRFLGLALHGDAEAPDLLKDAMAKAYMYESVWFAFGYREVREYKGDPWQDFYMKAVRLVEEFLKEWDNGC